MVVPDEIIEAAGDGDVAAVRNWLTSGRDANDTDSDRDETLLTKVVMAGAIMSDTHLEVARMLVEHGADVNQPPNMNKFGALHLCALS